MVSITCSTCVRPAGRAFAPLPARRQTAVSQRVAARGGDDAPPAPPAEVQQVAPPQYAPPPQYPYQYTQHQHQAPPPPPPAPAAPAASGGTPFWIWLIVGAAAMWVFQKVQEFRKNPMMAMAGMMGGMKPPASGAPAGGGDMSAMMEMMKNMQSQQQPQGGGAPANPWATPPAAQQAASRGSTINVTASEVPQAAPQTERNGSKFQEQKTQDASPAAAPTPPAQASEAAAPSFFADTASKPASPSNSFFADTASASSGGASAPPGSDASSSSSSNSEAMIENMLLMVADNKDLQAQLSQHLPESLQNEETWNWIKNNPEIRKELAKQVTPSIMEQMGDNPSFNQYATGAMGASDQGDMFKKIEDMGMDPNEMMGKLMGDPDLLALMTKPNVAAALMDIQKDPQSAFKYMSDPDVNAVMQKMMALNPGMMAGGPPPPAP